MRDRLEIIWDVSFLNVILAGFACTEETIISMIMLFLNLLTFTLIHRILWRKLFSLES